MSTLAPSPLHAGQQHREHRAKKTLLGRLIQWCFIVQEAMGIRNACPSLESSNGRKYSTIPSGLSPYFCYIALYFAIDPHTWQFSTKSLYAPSTGYNLGRTLLGLGIS